MHINSNPSFQEQHHLARAQVPSHWNQKLQKLPTGHHENSGGCLSHSHFNLDEEGNDGWVHQRVQSTMALEHENTSQVAAELSRGDMWGRQSELAPPLQHDGDLLQLSAQGRPALGEGSLLVKAGRQTLYYRSDACCRRNPVRQGAGCLPVPIRSAILPPCASPPGISNAPGLRTPGATMRGLRRCGKSMPTSGYSPRHTRSSTYQAPITGPLRTVSRKPQPGESCATIWSRWPILRRIVTADPTEAVCVEIAHPAGPLLVYGSIIAWGGYKGTDGTSQRWEEHYRYIEWHGRDWLRLRREFPSHPLITGGDYNQNRDGTRWYGTSKGRDLLSKALIEAGLRCVTEVDFVAAGKLEKRHTVDHLCMDEAMAARVENVGAWERTRPDGLLLSDHSGVMVDLRS